MNFIIVARHKATTKVWLRNKADYPTNIGTDAAHTIFFSSHARENAGPAMQALHELYDNNPSCIEIKIRKYETSLQAHRALLKIAEKFDVQNDSFKNPFLIAMEKTKAAPVNTDVTDDIELEAQAQAAAEAEADEADKQKKLRERINEIHRAAGRHHLVQ